jgi:hypothetical protein
MPRHAREPERRKHMSTVDAELEIAEPGVKALILR